MGYSRQFLIDAFLWRYHSTLLQNTNEYIDKFVKMVEDYYDKVGKDTFRVYASLTADEIAKFRLATGC